MSQKPRLIRKRIRKTKYVTLCLYLMFVLLTLSVVASYTWFSLSKTPRVSNMNVYVTSAAGLELSPDPGPENWQLQLNFYDTGALPVELRPVTWSEKNQCFWAAAFGNDGRLMSYNYWQPLVDGRHTIPNTEGYYIKSTFYARSGVVTDVSFTPPVVVNQEGTQGAGTYVIGVAGWDLESLIHVNNGKGAESSIRIGIRTTPVDSAGNPLTDSEGNPRKRGDMFIYEPNIDRHVGKNTGYYPTPSIDGTETLVPEDRLILQTATSWGDMETPEISNIKLEMGEFITNPTLFTVYPGEITKVELYIWLEGQDMDCVNPMKGAQLIANLQFTGSTEAQTGMVPIE